MAWSGYIDMLGTREIAKRSAQDLNVSLERFHSALRSGFEVFEDGWCAAFSDGAFFGSSQFESFEPFYRKVRNQLFQSKIYFRCSYLPGQINVDKDEDNRGIKLQPDAISSFFSLTFSGSAPDAYQKESEFKGIGASIYFPGQRMSGNALVDSIFVKHDGRRLVVQNYTDIAYSKFEISDPDDGLTKPTFDGELRLLDQLVSACHATLLQSNKIATYYISPFATVIRSSDLSSVSYTDDKGWGESSYIFRQMMSNSFTRVLRGLQGLELIYLVLFDHLYSQKNGNIPTIVEQLVLRKMLKVPGCIKDLDRIPTSVISAKARHRLIEIKIREAQ